MKNVKGQQRDENRVDRSNAVYWVVAIFSMTAFWILPWAYRTYVLPVLFADEIGEYAEYF